MKTKKTIFYGFFAVILALAFFACPEPDIDVPVTGVTLNKTNLALTVGGTDTLYATVAPEDATNKAVTWSSSNTNVATVNSNGVVSGVSAGTATITVTTVDGNKTANCSVNVTGGSSPSSITYTAQANGADGVTDTTAITLTFSSAVTGLTEADITVANGTGAVTKGSLSGSGTSWILGVTVTTPGNINISINKPGIDAKTKPVIVYKAGSYVPGTDGLAYELITTGSNANTYRVRQGTVVNDAVVIIPATYNELPVTEIGSIDDGYNNGEFKNSSVITGISIPASVTYIGKNAFNSCSNLTTVTFTAGSQLTTIDSSAFGFCYNLTDIIIPNSVTTIGNSAFQYCRSFTSINIPASVISIGYGAITRCSNLTSFTVDSGNPNYLSDNGILYNKDKTTLMRVPAKGINGAFTIPSSVRVIETYAFHGCADITDIIIPEGVTSIGEPNSGMYVFQECTGLTTVNIPASVTNIGSWPFIHCTNLTGITVNSGNLNYASENGILYNKGKTILIQAPGAISGAVTLPASVIEIGSQTFMYCAGITSITIPASVTKIGGSAFSGCTSLTSVTFGSGTITNGNFETNAFPEGSNGLGGNNLMTTYLAGGAGTYTRTSGGSTWTKQSGSGTFVPVTNITDVPTTATVGTALTLTGTVVPSDATNQNIAWSVISGSATVSGSTLNATSAGQVTVRATITNGAAQGTNYTKDFDITVSGGGTSQPSALTINNVAGNTTVKITTTTITNATDFDTLTGVVANGQGTHPYLSVYNNYPEVFTGTGTYNVMLRLVDSPNTVKFQNGVSFVDGNGTVNWSTMTEQSSSGTFVPVTNITGVPTTATVGTALTLTSTVVPSDATNQTIAWSVSSGSATVSGSTLNATSAGQVTVRATITNGTDQGTDYTKDFNITVSGGGTPPVTPDFQGGYSGSVTNSGDYMSSLLSMDGGITFNGSSISGPNMLGTGTVTIPNITIGSENAITQNGSNVGTWAYINSGGTKIGITVYFYETEAQLLILGKATVDGGQEGATFVGLSTSDMSTTYEGFLTKGVIQ